MSVLNRLLRSAPAPSAAVEIAANRVSAASVTARAGSVVVNAHAAESLSPGLVTPSLTGRNVSDPAALSAALGRVLERVGSPRRIGLVLPDPIAKISVLHFDEAPAKVEDLDRLIRFQTRKSAPFSIDDAQVSWSPGGDTNGRDFVVSIARRDVVREYEEAAAAAGAYAGLVDLATLNVANAVLAGRAPAGDWLLVHATTAYVSIAILRGPHLVFFRSRGADADDTIAEMVHQTAMYYEDRLRGGGFVRVLISGHAGDAADARMRQSLEARLQAPVEAVDTRGLVTLADRVDASPALVETLAPVVGLLARGSEAA